MANEVATVAAVFHSASNFVLSFCDASASLIIFG